MSHLFVPLFLVTALATQTPTSTPTPTEPVKPPLTITSDAPTSTPEPAATPSGQLIKGLVRARGSRVGIKDAGIIVLPKREVSVNTNAKGEFEVNVTTEDSSLLIRAPGFEDLEIRLSNGKIPDEPILLEPSADVLATGIIRARRKTEISQQSLGREEFSRLPGVGADPVRALQTLPSVISAGGANIVVRGGAPGDNKFYLDKFEVPFVFHFGGLGTVVPERMLEGVDLYAGGFSSVYGDAIGGIIQMRPETSTPEQMSGRYELGLIQTSGYLEGKWGEADDAIGYRVGLRRTYLEVLEPALKKIQGDSADFTVWPQATDYQFVLNGKHKNGTWQAFLFGAADRAAAKISNRNSDSEDGTAQFSLYNYFQISGVRYNMNLGNGWGLQIVPQQTYVLIDQRFFANVVKITSHEFSITTTVDKRISNELGFSFGIRPDFARAVTKVDAIQIPVGDTTFFDLDTAPRSTENLTRNIVSGTAFADVVYKPTADWTLNPGVTILKGGGKNQAALDPRFSARFRLNDAQALKAATGLYSQLPEPQFDSKDYGNPDLKPEKAVHYVAGIESKLWDDWESDVQIYYKDMFDLVGPAVVNPEKKYENSIRGRSKGVEFLLKKARKGRWNGWVSYGISKSERRDAEKETWAVSGFDRTHNLNVLAAYRLTGQWEIGSRFQFVSGAPYTPVLSGEFNQNTGRYRRAEVGATNSKRVPDFYQLDIRADYDSLYETWKINYYLEIQNITNRKNVQGVRYSEDFKENTYAYGIPILPIIGVIASF